MKDTVSNKKYIEYPHKKVSVITVTQYDDEHYELEGGVVGIIKITDYWDAHKKATFFQPVEYKRIY